MIYYFKMIEKDDGEFYSAVYCGASVGNEPGFATAAQELGSGSLHKIRWSMAVKLDGRDGRCCLRKWRSGDRGDPNLLKDRELAHPGLTELHVVETMSERKRKMFELSQAFVHCQAVLVRWKKSRRWSHGQESVKTRILVLFMMWTTLPRNESLVWQHGGKWVLDAGRSRKIGFAQTTQELEVFIQAYEPPVIRQY